MNDQRKFFFNTVYNHPRWKQLRLLHLSTNPLCLCCLHGHQYCTEGMKQSDKEKVDGYGKRVVTPAAHVDHVIPLVIDYERRFDPENLMALCIVCHSRKTCVVDNWLKKKVVIDRNHESLEDFE